MVLAGGSSSWVTRSRRGGEHAVLCSCGLWSVELDVQPTFGILTRRCVRRACPSRRPRTCGCAAAPRSPQSALVVMSHRLHAFPLLPCGDHLDPSFRELCARRIFRVEVPSVTKPLALELRHRSRNAGARNARSLASLAFVEAHLTGLVVELSSENVTSLERLHRRIR